MPALPRIHLTLVQKVSIIEKSGLQAFDRKKIAEKHGASKRKDSFGPLYCPRILNLTEIHGNLQVSVLIKKISVMNAIFITNEAWQKVSKITSF